MFKLNTNAACSIVPVEHKELINAQISEIGCTLEEAMIYNNQEDIDLLNKFGAIKWLEENIDHGGKEVVFTATRPARLDLSIAAVASEKDFIVVGLNMLMVREQYERGMNVLDMLKILFQHENVHLRQIHDGRLVTLGNVATFDGVEYPIITSPVTEEDFYTYLTSPWELEAYRVNAYSAGKKLSKLLTHIFTSSLGYAPKEGFFERFDDDCKSSQ